MTSRTHPKAMAENRVALQSIVVKEVSPQRNIFLKFVTGRSPNPEYISE